MTENLSVNMVRELVSITSAENSDCVSNAELGLKKLRALGLNGKIIYVNAINHAYLVPTNFSIHEIALNPPTKVTLENGKTSMVSFEDFTIEELFKMVLSGEADDIT